VTAFGNIINASETPATACGIAPLSVVPATFTYQTTTAQNALTGTVNTPVDIPPGGIQNYVFAFGATAPFPRTEVVLTFNCAEGSASTLSGINTFFLRATATPAPALVVIALTPSADGIVHLASTGVFVVATVNFGAPGLVTVSTDTSTVPLPLSILVCETDPQSGECLAPPIPSVQTQINTNATPTFGFFVTGSGPIPFDPANNRIQVHLEGGDGGGGTSVAVCSVPLCP
jgi:hypothetical protein